MAQDLKSSSDRFHKENNINGKSDKGNFIFNNKDITCYFIKNLDSFIKEIQKYLLQLKVLYTYKSVN